MWSRRSDLPRDRDALGRFLPWLIAFMVYLAILALAGTLVLNSLAGRWDKGVSGTFTVQIPPAGDAQEDARRSRAAVELLRGLPEVVHAEPIAPARLMTLLEPWLGTTAVAEDLPLPRLIDVEIRPGSPIDGPALARLLAAAAPDALVDDHGVWLARLVRLVRSGQALAAAVLLLIGAATVATVVFTTRTGLAVHQDVIEVLHMIGAQDGYIARQFAERALVLGLQGGIIGLGLAVPTLFALGALAARFGGGWLPELALAPAEWAALATLPAVAALIAMLTARLTVTRTLGRMP